MYIYVYHCMSFNKVHTIISIELCTSLFTALYASRETFPRVYHVVGGLMFVMYNEYKKCLVP